LSTLRPAVSLSIAGFACAIVGAAFILAALLLLALSFPGMTEYQFSFFAIAMFVTALAAEFAIGDEVRQLLRRR